MFNEIKFFVTGSEFFTRDRNEPTSAFITLTLVPHDNKYKHKGEFEIVIDLDDIKKITKNSDVKKKVELLKKMGKTDYDSWITIATTMYDGISKEIDRKKIKLVF